MPQFESLWAGGPMFAQAEHFRMGTDSILLAHFASPRGRNAIDLGCASGIIGVLMLANAPKLHVTGLEIVPEAAELARENMHVNGFAERSRVVCGDIREHRQLFTAGGFDTVVANPPYFPAGSGKAPQDAGRAAARGELSCTLEDVCTAAAFLCRTGGSFYIVHKPERLAELMCCMSAHGLEPKRMRMVCHTAGAAPNLLLVEGRRGAKPGMRIEPALILREADGSETEEIRRIYHR